MERVTKGFTHLKIVTLQNEVIKVKSKTENIPRRKATSKLCSGLEVVVLLAKL